MRSDQPPINLRPVRWPYTRAGLFLWINIMPHKQPRPCKYPGCPETTIDPSGYCEPHKKAVNKSYEQTRETSTQRGYDRRWQKTRIFILNRDPICKICNRAPSTEVDHIIPRKKGGTDDPRNLQGACKPCHSTKTATEDGRWE